MKPKPGEQGAAMLVTVGIMILVAVNTVWCLWPS